VTCINIEKIKYIEKSLIKKKVRDYKIIETNEKVFSYKNVSKKIEYETIVTNKILVMFKFCQKTAKFMVTDNIPESMINLLIDIGKNTCLSELSFGGDINWHTSVFNNFSGKRSEKHKNLFDNFDPKKYLIWLNGEIAEISKKINFTVSCTYKVCLCQYNLLANDGFAEQYQLNSEFFCTDDKTFQKKALLKNCVLSESFANLAVKQLKRNLILNTQKNLDMRQPVLVKAAAMAQLLNEYAALFYASNVYFKQSYIKKRDIGNKIAKSTFSLAALPYIGMKFDAEGNKIKKKQIIKNGKLVDLLSNNAAAACLRIKSCGNASCSDFEDIAHQRLKMLINPELLANAQKTAVTLHHFEYIFLDINERIFNGVAVCSDSENNRYLASVNFSAKEFFNKIYSAGHRGKWVENVFCPDVVVSF
jgi:hypothetical protein